MIVDRIGSGLQDKHVLAADILLDFDENFLIGEAADAGFSKRDVQIFRDLLCQNPVGIARENFHAKGPGFVVAGRLAG